MGQACGSVYVYVHVLQYSKCNLTLEYSAQIPKFILQTKSKLQIHIQKPAD